MSRCEIHILTYGIQDYFMFSLNNIYIRCYFEQCIWDSPDLFGSHCFEIDICTS